MNSMVRANTLFEGIAQQANSRPDAIALEALNRKPLDYAALLQHIESTRHTLNDLGIVGGHRVALVLPNGPELALASLAVISTCSAAPINPDYKQVEYEMMFTRLRPSIVIMPSGLAHAAREAAGRLNIPVLELEINTDDSAGIFNLKVSQGLERIDNEAVASPDEAMVLQTSGTTGQPKIVPLTQSNLASSAHNLIRSLGLTAEDRVLHFLPMFHIGGIVDVLGAPLLSGGTVFCAPSFSATDFYRDLASFKPTWTQGVPIMLEEMLSQCEQHQGIVASHTLRFVRSVSAPLPVERMQAFEAAFNTPVIEIYGMTETAGVITSNPLPPASRKQGSVGISAGPEVATAAVDGTILPQGEVGEIVVKGSNVISSYENAPEDNALAFRHGWFHTGDLGRIDEEGYLFLTGRVKDMINRGGEKVTPQEVDDTLRQHPEIRDAATFAIPHPTLGEDVAALVVLEPNSTLTEQDVKAYSREQMAFFKVPKNIHFVESVPLGANGKVQRALIAAEYGSLESQKTSRPSYRAPESVVSKALFDMWASILDTSDIGLDDDFFDIGGDSLKAASFINSLQQKWGETIYVSSVFDAPTIALYEKYLDQHYPEIVAKITGGSVKRDLGSVGKVTPAMLEQLEAMLARPITKAATPLAKKNKRAIFVLSPPRSGSTLLRAMMAGNPKLFAPPELYLLSYENMADRKKWFSGSHRSQLEGLVRAMMQARNESAEHCQAFIAELEAKACTVADFYAMMQEWLGERLLVDKTPAYAVDLAALLRAESYFEDAFYVHLLRHPYAMIRSFDEAKLDQLWFPRLVGSDAFSLDKFPFARLQLAEMIWFMLHRNILEFLQDIPSDRQCQLRFEDVVAKPEPTMRSLCDSMGVPFDAEMLNPQGSKKDRMTDGIHDVSRMIGDPKFHQHKKIESGVADQWKTAYEYDFLSEETMKLANALGFDETVASVRGREEIEL
ncbi:MAG: AMP-binding protein [Pseudohongiellaceae bacterium]|nr:AMP-binding protein [Pseudohongiellaceae bacterium]